jgi:predicted Fe-Mo cluster-binding NifX family protein
MSERALKIAVVTDDGKTISQHFGRAMYYVVYDVQNGVIKGSEMRDKVAHHTGGEHHGHEEGGHHGLEANAKHSSMLSNVSDCEVLIARGMGWGAHEAIKGAGLKPFITDMELAENAVNAFVAGKLDDHIEKLH